MSTLALSSTLAVNGTPRRHTDRYRHQAGAIPTGCATMFATFHHWPISAPKGAVARDALARSMTDAGGLDE